MKVIILSVFLVSTLFADKYEDHFSNIYQEKVWGANEEGLGWSGDGSKYENALPYLIYLTKFLRKHKIKSVVDLGCGDWELSKRINWRGIDYKGYDVVDSVIKRNIDRFSSDNIQFFSQNFLKEDVPQADLLICKHVLQHIPNEDVFHFLKFLPKFKHCLILNAAPHTDYDSNNNLPFGEDRGIDITVPPFKIKGKIVLSYVNGFPQILTHIDNSILQQ